MTTESDEDVENFNLGRPLRSLKVDITNGYVQDFVQQKTKGVSYVLHRDHLEEWEDN